MILDVSWPQFICALYINDLIHTILPPKQDSWSCNPYLRNFWIHETEEGIYWPLELLNLSVFLPGGNTGWLSPHWIGQRMSHGQARAIRMKKKNTSLLERGGSYFWLILNLPTGNFISKKIRHDTGLEQYKCSLCTDK